MTTLTILSYEPTAFDFASSEVMRITVIVFAVLFHLFLIRYVYQDAQDRGDPNKMQWALMVLFSNIFGTIIYFYVTKDLAPKIHLVSALWMINGFFLLTIGGLFLFSTGPYVVQMFVGYALLMGFILPITLLLVVTGGCALWVGFQVIKDILTGSEVRTSLIFAVLGLTSLLIVILTLVLSLVTTEPPWLPGYIQCIFMCFILVSYTPSIRNKV